MNYSVKELREKLDEKITRLGIDSRFKENPAYASALEEIDHLIMTINMLKEDETVTVKEEGSKISFDWISDVGERYSMIIYSSSSETFSCIRTEEKKPYLGKDGKTVREKIVIEKVATIDELGSITLRTNGALVDNIDCSVGRCNNRTWTENMYYQPSGVMVNREYRGFQNNELNEDFDRVEINSLLWIPRSGLDNDLLNHLCETRTLLLRDKLDTATIHFEDKKRNIEYYSVVPLKQEHGLRNMELPVGYDPQNVVIHPLSQEQIEAMIQRESDPKVAEGLRKFAVDRVNYSYNSPGNKNLFIEEISQSQGMSK